jgi:hypothetical protein
LNQGYKSHLNRSITSNETEVAIQSVNKEKPKIQWILYQTFKELIFLKLFHEIEREGAVPNSFYETSIIFIPKPDKDTTKNRIIDQYL